MKPTTILFLFSIFFSSHVFAWTISADFEYPQATADTMAELPNPDAFHAAAGRSRYADTPALSGNQSGSVLATEGSTGFGVWGGGFNFPSLLREGDEVWYRVNVYYPAGWDFSCGGCTEGLKFMRIHTKSGLEANLGANEGYHSILIKNDGSDNYLIRASSEINWETFPFARDLGTPIQKDQWHTYEMYIKFSSVADQGIYRIWQDGLLIFEALNYATLQSPTSLSKLAYLYSYWNNGAPKTQTSYVDDIIITNEIPGRKDANGNPYIGVGASIYIAPPKEPASVSGQKN